MSGESKKTAVPQKARTGSDAGKGAAKPRRKKASAPPPPEPNSLHTLAWVAAAIILIDQISKYYVVHVLRLDRLREIDVLPPWINLRMAWNQGVNFGLFSSSNDPMRWVLIAIAIAVCLWVIIWVRRTRPGRFTQLAAGLLIGGAIGNVIDRLLYGAVADFLNMSLPNWRNPYSFNVADIAIFAGAFGLILQPPQSNRPGADKTRDAPAK
ncbi:signal peptidase II [Paracoccus isoporae]|uniref:Lipoprotein signal peptidase n=1 Tax=Paracoccus isoporae TaxID=591205 RepID=A0A1G6YQC8_9RHOB|nr:signal peptidase II [Paracoccus isoporae]